MYYSYFFSYVVSFCLTNKCWQKWLCHPVSAAVNAQLTDSCSVTDCKLCYPEVQRDAEPASPPTLSHFFFPVQSFLSLHHICYSHSPFFPFSFRCHFLFLSPSLLKAFSISTHTFSIKLAYQFSFGFFLLKQQQQKQEQE